MTKLNPNASEFKFNPDAASWSPAPYGSSANVQPPAAATVEQPPPQNTPNYANVVRSEQAPSVPNYANAVRRQEAPVQGDPRHRAYQNPWGYTNASSFAHGMAESSPAFQSSLHGNAALVNSRGVPPEASEYSRGAFQPNAAAGLTMHTRSLPTTGPEQMPIAANAKPRLNNFATRPVRASPTYPAAVAAVATANLREQPESLDTCERMIGSDETPSVQVPASPPRAAIQTRTGVAPPPLQATTQPTQAAEPVRLAQDLSLQQKLLSSKASSPLRQPRSSKLDQQRSSERVPAPTKPPQVQVKAGMTSFAEVASGRQRPPERPAVPPPSLSSRDVETPASKTTPSVVKTPTVKTPIAKTPTKKTPVAKTPVAKTPMMKTPVAETPMVKTPVANTSQEKEREKKEDDAQEIAQSANLDISSDRKTIIKYTIEAILAVRAAFADPPSELLDNEDLPLRGTPTYTTLMDPNTIPFSSDFNQRTPTSRKRGNSRRLKGGSFSNSPVNRNLDSLNQSPRLERHSQHSIDEHDDDKASQVSQAARTPRQLEATTPKSPGPPYKNSPLHSVRKADTDPPLSPSKFGFGRRGLPKAAEANRGLISQLLESGPRAPREEKEDDSRPTSMSKNAATVIAATRQRETNASRSNGVDSHRFDGGSKDRHNKMNSSWRSRAESSRSRAHGEHSQTHSSWRDHPHPPRHRVRHHESMEKLHHSEDRWKMERNQDEIQNISSAILSILNKLTPESFDKLSEKATSLKIDNVETFEAFCGCMFEKAILEASFASMYAQFFSRLAQSLPSFTSEDGKQVNLRTVLITKCYQHLVEDPDTSHLEELTGDEREEAEMKLKDQQIGNVVLMGELFKNGILAESVVHVCIEMMLDDTDTSEEDIECLVTFLQTVGKLVDRTSSGIMNTYFEKITSMSKSKSFQPRLRFMLQDLIDLRNHKWKLRRAKVVDPKTLEDVRKAKESSNRGKNWDRLSSKNMPTKSSRSKQYWGESRKPLVLTKKTHSSSSRDDRSGFARAWGGSHSGRPNLHVDDDEHHHHSRSEANRKLDTPQLQRKVNALVREYFSCNDINEALLCFDELDKKAHSQTVERVLALAFDMKHRERQQANALLRELVKRDKLSSEELVAGLSSLFSNFGDIAIDIPQAPQHLAVALSSLVSNDHLSLRSALEILSHESKSYYSHQVALKLLSVLDQEARPKLVSGWEKVNKKAFESLFPATQRESMEKCLMAASLPFIQL